MYMKKSLQHFINKLQTGGNLNSGYLALKKIRGGILLVNNGDCTNGDCSGTNTSRCSNTGDCSQATNKVSCSNTGGPGCCGS